MPLVPWNASWSDHTVFVGEVKTAVLHRDAAALELSSTGWQYGG